MKIAVRPLTTLLIVASVVLDAVLVVKARYPREYSGLLSGLILGQIGALAIWAAASEAHRLSRGAMLVVVTAAAAVLTGRQVANNVNNWLGLLAGYAFSVWLSVTLLEVVRPRWASRDPRDDDSQRWRIPLIEVFGWTIVVALISFGARHMEFKFLQRGGDVYVTMVAILLFPVVSSLLFSAEFHWRELLKGALFITAAHAVATLIVYQRGRGPLLVSVMWTQAAYLAAWNLVRGIENRLPAASSSVESAGEDAAANLEGPKLFEADD